MSSWVVCKVERVVLTCCVIRLMSSGLRSVREGIKAFFEDLYHKAVKGG